MLNTLQNMKTKNFHDIWTSTITMTWHDTLHPLSYPCPQQSWQLIPCFLRAIRLALWLSLPFLYRLCLVVLLLPIHFCLKWFHLTCSGAISTRLTEVFQRLDGFSSAVLDLTLTAEDAALLLVALVDFCFNSSREDVGKTIQRLVIFSKQQLVFSRSCKHLLFQNM